ncbi:two-component system sensor histidine kinase UhpB [Chryseobacterium defluvii]|uniref:Two-component system sensor histidine kinase UhpB n=1 Tax=Chryseobacterium defluvii TaxID=160396 RepID=A0A840KB11_9FLAO|nr:histidine kinase [Chryseobacterium defluvii]MBB4804733.1 two-component system sensor histidine kinase UhpB [Chryseobacterium defluvii]
MYKIALGIIIVMLLVCLLVMFCVILVRLHIYKVTNYQKDIHQKDLDFQKTLTQSIMESQEELRTQIAGDLHDDIGQQITVLNFQIENMKLDFPEVNPSLRHLSSSLGKLSESVRSTSHRIHPSFSENKSIEKRIRKDLEYLGQNHTIEFSFSCPENESSEILPEYSHILFRMYQEIINNILKHSGADRVFIKLQFQPYFLLEISDNGKGFIPKHDNAKLGLNTLRKRAEIINFELKVVSELQKGTAIQIFEKNPN